MTGRVLVALAVALVGVGPTTRAMADNAHLVVAFPGLTQHAAAWDRFQAEAAGRGVRLVVPEFPRVNGLPGVGGHEVNEQAIDAAIRSALSTLAEGERMSVVLYSQSAANFLGWAAALSAERRRAVFERISQVVVLDPSLRQTDLWWLKAEPVRSLVSLLEMNGNWYPSVAELLESDGNAYLASVRGSYSAIGATSRETGTAWTVLTLDNHVVSPREAAAFAGALQQAGADVRFYDTRGMFLDVHGSPGGNLGMFPGGRNSSGDEAIREVYTRGRHGFHLGAGDRERLQSAVQSRLELEATVREFVWRHVGASTGHDAHASQASGRNQSPEPSSRSDVPPRSFPPDRVGGVDLREVGRKTMYVGLPANRNTGGVAIAFSTPADGSRQESSVAIDAFLAGSLVHPSSLWVNLHPDEPNRISDARLGRSSLVRVLLLADLELKREMARVTHPETMSGHAYWSRVGDSSGTASATRVWIVPGPTVVRVWDGQAYLESARLDVQLEASRSAHASGTASETARNDAALVLPRLREAVNQSPLFADLRGAYAGLVLAHAIRTTTPHARATVPAAWEDPSWAPRHVWETYVQSYRQGEYDVTLEQSTIRGRMVTVTRTRYVSGGVDFTALGRLPQVVFLEEPPGPDVLTSLVSALSPAGWPGSPHLTGVVMSLDEPDALDSARPHQPVSAQSAREGLSSQKPERQSERNGVTFTVAATRVLLGLIGGLLLLTVPVAIARRTGLGSDD